MALGIEIMLIVGAVMISLIVLAVSPLARAICLDSIIHPRYKCLWENRGGKIQEIQACIGKPKES